MLKSLLALSIPYFFMNSFLFAEVEKKGINVNEQTIATNKDKSDFTHEELNDLYLKYQEELSKNTKNPLSLYNLALVEMKQGQLGWALAHTEASLYLAPLFKNAKELRKEIIEQVIDTRREPPSEQVSMLARSFDYLPSFLISLILGISIFSFLYSASLTYKKAYISIIDFKKEKKYMHISLALTLLLLPIFQLKSQNFNQRWACVITKEAKLVSGPSLEHRFIKSLKEGDCVKVENYKKDWTAISTSEEKKGWVSANDLHPARGRKLTLNSSKQ